MARWRSSSRTASRSSCPSTTRSSGSSRRSRRPRHRVPVPLRARGRRRRLDRRHRDCCGTAACPTTPTHPPRAQPGQGRGGAHGAGRRAAAFSAIFDADLEYDPRDLVGLSGPSRAAANAVVRRARLRRLHEPLVLVRHGQPVVTLAANMLFNVYLHDLMTCHKAMRTDVFRSATAARKRLQHRAGDRRAADPARRADLRGAGEATWRAPPEGKKLTAGDGFRVLWTLLRCRVTRR